MLWAQAAALALMIWYFGVEMARAGKPVERRFYMSRSRVLLTTAIGVALQAAAGMYDKLIGWPG